MKLDPVFLVAPEPERRASAVCTRRALALWSLAAAGLGLGAGAYLARWRPARAAHEPPLDASLAWALDLQSGPLDGLLAAADAFLARAVTFADPRLEPGLRRLGEAVLEDHPLCGPDRLPLARKLAAVLSALPCSEELRTLGERLERLR